LRRISAGVKVRVMLNPARRSGEPENEVTRKTLEAAGIEVLDSNPAIDVTHEKSMVVDDEIAFIQSLNWETKNLTVTRDYAVVTSHRHEVASPPGSFDSRRELAIEVHDEAVVNRLQQLVHHDWSHSHPLDLSDEGLLADLAEIDAEAANELAFDNGGNGKV
jgi:phosphatidylserine/phosphatidylglycerophosphate/cardiolipin synthase-like enzyme